MTIDWKAANSPAEHAEAKLEALRAAAQALVDKIESLRPWPLWMQMVQYDLAALEVALKAVGS